MEDTENQIVTFANAIQRRRNVLLKLSASQCFGQEELQGSEYVLRLDGGVQKFCDKTDDRYQRQQTKKPKEYPFYESVLFLLLLLVF